MNHHAAQQPTPEMNWNQMPAPQKSAAAIVGFVLGVLALVGSWIPIFNNISGIAALVGLVFAVVGMIGTMRGKRSGRGLAIAAVVLNVLSFAIVLGTQSAYSTAFDEALDGAMVDTEDVAVEQQAGDGAEATEGASSASESDASVEQASSEKYAISDEAMDGDEFSVTISGVFTNQTDEDLSYIQLTYTLFDADGAQIGSAYANANNLAAGGSWKFEATGFEPLAEVASYELADVTGF